MTYALGERFSLNTSKRLTTPDSTNFEAFQKIDPVPVARNTFTRAEGRELLQEEPLFYRTKYSQGKKPPFNVSCPRTDPAASPNGFVSFYPGPGSYTTRMSSIKTNFVVRESQGQTVLSSLTKAEPGYYFTRDKGGLSKHIQPLKLDKTKRQTWT